MNVQPDPEKPAPATPVDQATLDRIFGEVLPESTRDDLDSPGSSRDRGADEWYRANRPPHHGG